ncbi:TetR/AcrR family transcriptional regulator [Actinokineospora sp. HUAS TT18]|uniref:TetR/AcrR family transcriptional regulator n=1 Tax=Actinokineospora sp. HUAS TT18 TaxID=3447451 RepID=UPI003F528D50
MSEQRRSTNARAYRMGKRAEDVAETRRRIVEAAVRLHGTVGPAATTIAGIADAAGVTRLTVYRHFPDDEVLFDACSAHWLGAQRLPDVERWRAEADPAERLRVGLADLYRFYRDGVTMLRRVHRDRAELPATHQQRLDDTDARNRDALLEVFGTIDQRRAALIGHAVSFWTWHSLCVDNGLPQDAAVEAMTALVMG